MDKLPEHYKPWAEYAYWSGWRIQEILSRQWKHVDRKRRAICLEAGETKNDESREFPYGQVPGLVHLIEQQAQYGDRWSLIRGEIVPWVFSNKGGRIKMNYSIWRRASELARIGHKVPHDYRRTPLRRFEEAGVSRKVAMRLTGHLDDGCYERYHIVNDDDTTRAVAKVWGFVSEEKGAKGPKVP
jgi:integrase